MSLKLKTITGLKLEDSLARDWTGLAAQTPVDPLFGRVEWAQEWWRAFGLAGKKLNLVTLTKDQALIGLAQLHRNPENWSGLKARVLAPLSRTTSEYVDLLIPPQPESALALLEHLVREKEWDVLSLSRLPQASPNRIIFIEAAGSLGLKWHQEAEQDSPYLALEGNFEEFLKERFSSNFRNKIRRMKKRLAALGRLEFEWVTSAQRFEEIFDQLLRVERSSWKGSEGLGIFNTGIRTDFYRRIALKMADQGLLAVHLMLLDGAVIAYHYGFIARGRYYDYNLAFDPAFQRHSPGLVSLGDLLSRCWDMGLEVFDFLRGAEEYKSLWTDTATRNINLHIFAPTAKGRALALSKQARNTARRLKRAAGKGSKPGEADFIIHPAILTGASL